MRCQSLARERHSCLPFLIPVSPPLPFSSSLPSPLTSSCHRTENLHIHLHLPSPSLPPPPQHLHFALVLNESICPLRLILVLATPPPTSLCASAGFSKFRPARKELSPASYRSADCETRREVWDERERERQGEKGEVREKEGRRNKHREEERRKSKELVHRGLLCIR